MHAACLFLAAVLPTESSTQLRSFYVLSEVWSQLPRLGSNLQASCLSLSAGIRDVCYHAQVNYSQLQS